MLRMAVLNYTYLKLKMPGPCGVITIGTSFQRTYKCKLECCEHAAAIVASKELAAIRKEVIEEAPDPKRSARSFKPMEGTKEVLIDPSFSKGKVVRIGTMFPSNRKARSSTSSTPIETSLHENPRTCQAFREKSPSTP